MKISFQTQNMQEFNMSSGVHGEKNADKSRYKEFRTDFFGDEQYIPMNMMSGVEKGKSLIEIQEDAAVQNVAVTRDYMTLMSHTMSGEDYAKMQEEGFDFSGAEPDEVVTIVDKIKAELIRAGVNVAGYTDDLSLDTLKEALGSEALAKALKESFQSMDLPMEAAQASDIRIAWDMTKKLQPLSEGDMIYLIDNHMQPEIWNLYLAQNSGARLNAGAAPKFFREDVQGYFTVNAGAERLRQDAVFASREDMPAQMQKYLEQMGVDVTDENVEQGLWLLDRGLPVTKDNLYRLDGLNKIEFLVSAEQFAQAVASAALEGKKPIHANLAESENIYQKANRYMDMYAQDSNWTDLIGDVTGRRQLEEVRLRMTAEVNVRLLRSGFAIDTAPMEELVEALKQAEQQVAQSLFPASERAVEQYRLFTQTNRTVKEIPGLPAQVLGHFADAESVLTFRELHSQATKLSESASLTTAFVNASEAYETLMTAPRKDMGDSIWKAFFSVDALLSEMGMELNDANRKAVRVLGYNRMTVDEANVNKIVEAQAQVETVVNKMTPAAVLKMIRDGVNPLDTNLAELNTYFDALPSEYAQEAENYARFLYGLEKNNDITAKERESYIGIYRMVRQLEKTDGAAVGALVNTGAELQFANLLTAVRSSKFKGMDVRADDHLGTLTELVQKGENISAQIAKAFLGEVKEMLTEVSEKPEIKEAYLKEQVEEIRSAAQAPREAVEMLVRGQLPLNASHLLAATGLTENAANPFKSLREKAQQLKAAPEGLWQQVGMKEAFTTSYGQMLTGLQEDIEEYTFGEGQTEPAVLTSVDVKQLQMYHKQLSILGKVAHRSDTNSKEEYMIPMYFGEQVTRVHLTVENGSTEKGTVSIKWEGVSLEQLGMKLRVGKEVLHWSAEGKTPEGIMEVNRVADIFIRMASENWKVEQDNIAEIPEAAPAYRGRSWLQQNLSEQLQQEPVEEAVDNAELYRVAEMVLWAIERGKYEN